MGWGGDRRSKNYVPKAKQAAPEPAPAPAAIPAEPRQRSLFDPATVSALIERSEHYARTKQRRPEFNPFQLPQNAHPPRVRPAGKKLRLAADSAITDTMNWASAEWTGGIFSGIAAEGLMFLGYPYLAELAQRPEYRTISEIIADDTTRQWIDFEVTGDKQENARRAEKDPAGEAERMADPDERKKRVAAAGKTDKVKALKDDQERLEVRDRFYALVRDDGFFGRGHLFMDFGKDIDLASSDDELSMPIGDGRDGISKRKIGRKSFKRLKVVEAVWTSPMAVNSLNPLAADWYAPQIWYVMGKAIHASRFLTFIGRPVPDMLKPAYSFGGLSLTQIAKPYVDSWLTTRSSVTELIRAFSVMVLSTDLSTLMQGGSAADALGRAALFNALRDNQGLMLINKATEEFSNVSASLSGLHELQAQSQEHICLQGSVFIETDRGSIPIKDVRPDDSVLTRAGFFPIKWVGITGHADTLIEIEAGGSTVMATKDHPVWSEATREFVPAKYVSPFHRLLRLPNYENTERLSRGVDASGGLLKKDIIEIRKLGVSSIALCGRRIGVLFRMALTSITRMMTGPTIGGATLNFSLERSMWLATSGSGSISLRRPIPRNASFVGATLQASSRITDLSSAQRHAKTNPTGFAKDGSSPPTPNTALSAAKSFRPSGLMPVSALAHACSVPVSRVSVRNVPRQPVYNIEVDGPPEFFANGLLVHNCSVVRIPLVKYTGVSPSGLQATTEGELQVYDDTIGAFQNRLVRPNLTRVINFEQMSMWGEVDPEISYVFQPLRVMTESERAEKQEKDAKRDETWVNLGALAPEEVRKRIVDDPELPYADLDPDDVPDLEQEEEEGLMPGGKKPGDGGGSEGGPGADDIGQNADGSFNSFPASELAKKTAERDSDEAATSYAIEQTSGTGETTESDEEDDNLSDLDELDDLIEEDQ